MNRLAIKKVLMCKPLCFDSLDYIINPWMHPGTINKKLAMQQWQNLVEIYKTKGMDVEIINQQKGNSDMVFAADQAIIQGKKALLSRFWYKQRQNETAYYEKWFKQKGYTINYLSKDVYFEGNGDSFLWNNKLFIGIGFRANQKTCNEVSKLLDIEVIPLEIIDPKFYHLDVGFSR